MYSLAEQDLVKYQKALRFPLDLEREFRIDFSQRSASAQREFFTLGMFLYLAFAILDYWALPLTYRYAWGLRLVGELFLVAGIFGTRTSYYRRFISFYGPIWGFIAGITILIMIYLAEPQEPGYTFYAFGLLLTTTAIYITGNADLIVPSLFGWLTVVLYAVIATNTHDVMDAYSSRLTFFVVTFFLAGMNVLGMIIGTYLTRAYRRDFLQRRVIEQQHATEVLLRDQAEQLLHNILPVPVAERLQRGEKVADHFREVSILFADIVDFTPFTANLKPDDLVDILNEIFFYFDELADRYALEKIKTIGDCYMVAAGLPRPRSDHAEVLVQLGLEMTDYFRRHQFAGRNLGLRVGINTGPVVAGVIGRRKFFYDLWGDAVNTASRMESHGRSGAVQITRATYNLVKDKFICRSKGIIEVKGKGKMPVWHVLRSK